MTRSVGTGVRSSTVTVFVYGMEDPADLDSDDASAEISVVKTFKAFTKGSPTMDGKVFAKLTRDCSLIDSVLTPTFVDLIFQKVKDKGKRQITYVRSLDVSFAVKCLF